VRTLDVTEIDMGPLAPDTERSRARTSVMNNGATTVVTEDGEAARIRQALYRTDENQLATIVPAFRPELTARDIARFNDLGYFAMEGLLSPAEVTDCKAALSDLIAHRHELGDEIWVQEEPVFDQGIATPSSVELELRVRKLARFVKADARLAAAAAQPRLMSLLDQLIGPGHRLIQDMALMKPPLKGSEKPWHQDNAYFDWTPLAGILGVWIALDEATVENGCMQIIPGSQRAGPVPHFHVRDCQLDDRRVDVEHIEVVPLKPGGVLFFAGLLHHGTPANQSTNRRRALQFHYAAAHCRRMTFREHMDHFSDGAFYTGCRDWDMEAGVSRAILEA
jgi:phytanoyl-CoA hydroxylase